MTLTKKRKKILLIAIPAVVVIAAVAVILFLLLQPKEEEGMRLEILDPQDGTAVVVAVQDGIEDVNDIALPLDFYRFNPPEGYVQQQNAEDNANRLSTSYTDIFVKEGANLGEETTITFTQRIALEQSSLSIGNYFRQEVEFGDLKVIYFRSGDDGSTSVPVSGAYWLYGNSLLELRCTERLQQDEVLELVHRVDYSGDRTPNYTPLQLQRGGVVVTETGAYTSHTIQNFSSFGNPQLPAPIVPYDFETPPEGFSAYTALESDTTEWVNDVPEELQAASVIVRYRNQQGDRLILTNLPGPGSLFAAARLDMQDEQEVAQVLDVTVNGNPGFFYADYDTSYLAWISDYLTLEMTYEGQITQEEMLALAESLVQKPMEETSSTLSSE